MILKNKKLKRFSFLLIACFSISLATFFVLKALDEKIVFFYTPTKLYEKEEERLEYIRVGGLVKERSISFSDDGLKVNFMITDNKKFVNERLEEVISFIPELKDFMERQAFQLSGGQQKLVALARAMVIGKRLLLLDEPFEGVAPALAERLVELISSLNQSNLITMITESDETFSKKIKADIIRIERGKIL